MIGRTIVAPLAIMGLTAGMANAQSEGWPQLFDSAQTGDETLPILSEPRSGAAPIAAFASDAEGIEGVGLSADGDWLSVRAGEQMGYVAMSALTPSDSAPSLRCFGTEPFWSLDVATGSFDLSGQQSTLTSDVEVALPEFLLTGAQSFSTTDEALTLITAGDTACSDGMSDTTYMIDAMVTYLKAPDQIEFLLGCCSIGSATPSFAE